MEEQLQSMKIVDNEDLKTHLNELKAHFQLMMQHRKNLIEMGSTISDQRFNIIIMSSLPSSYRPTLQTITTNIMIGRSSGSPSKGLSADDLMAFIIKKAQHHAINNEPTKMAEFTLAAKSKGPWKSKKKTSEKEKGKSDLKCDNCG